MSESQESIDNWGSDRDKDPVKKLEELGEEVVQQLKKGKNPNIEIPSRGLSNVHYDESDGILKLGNSTSKRYLKNVSHARKFMQTLLVASYSKKLIKEDRHAGIRELYYALKHNIEDTDKNTFDDQNESNPVVEDLERSLDLLREELNLSADRRGYVYGDLLIQDGEDEFNCSELGLGGWAVPGNVEHIKFNKIKTDYALVVETAAMADRLIEEDFAPENNALIIATQGQPARGIRRLIRRLRYEEELPIYVFTDGDPYGWYIYSTLKQGSINLAYLSHKLGVPDAKFIGMTMDDIEEYDLHGVTEKLKGEEPNRNGEGATKDYKRILEEMDYPWFDTPEWKDQLEKALEKGERIEQQALANKSLDFVSNVYLPEKINNERFLS